MSDSSSQSIERLYDLLGDNVVLLPIPKGMKGPKMKGWQLTTVKQSKSPEYQSRLCSHGNTGVLLGQRSGGLCSIDIDFEDGVEAFLADNPSFRKSLTTRGNRGVNIWLQAEGEYPPLTKLELDGQPWGEWRADGGQTVIAGIHPSGCRYQFQNVAKPITCRYEDINWPAGVTPPLLHTYSSELSTSLHQSTNSTSSALSTSQPMSGSDGATGASIADKTIIALKAEKAFSDASSGIDRLYKRYVADRINALQGERNSAIVAMMTFLAHAVSPEIALRLAEHFYDMNAAIWYDSKDQHMQEATAHLKAVLREYPGHLNAGERAIYEHLDETRRVVFRVCRDLARCTSQKDFPPPAFFLSCNDLGRRSGVHPQEALRFLRQFVSLGILKEEKKGQKREKGVQGKATVYSWNLAE